MTMTMLTRWLGQRTRPPTRRPVVRRVPARYRPLALEVLESRWCPGGLGFEAEGGPPVVRDRPEAVAVGDFLPEDRRDLASANLLGATLNVLLGDGAGGLGPSAATNVRGALGFVPLTLGEFTHDGNPNLAAANVNPSMIRVVLSDDVGGFGPAGGIPFVVGAPPHNVAAGNFNRDGNRDLAPANGNRSELTMRLGHSSGDAAAASDFPCAVEERPGHTVAATNRDSKQDLATANVLGGAVSVLLGVGWGLCTGRRRDAGFVAPPLGGSGRSPQKGGTDNKVRHKGELQITFASDFDTDDTIEDNALWQFLSRSAPRPS